MLPSPRPEAQSLRPDSWLSRSFYQPHSTQHWVYSTRRLTHRVTRCGGKSLLLLWGGVFEGLAVGRCDFYGGYRQAKVVYGVVATFSFAAGFWQRVICGWCLAWDMWDSTITLANGLEDRNLGATEIEIGMVVLEHLQHERVQDSRKRNAWDWRPCKSQEMRLLPPNRQTRRWPGHTTAMGWFPRKSVRQSTPCLVLPSG